MVIRSPFWLAHGVTATSACQSRSLEAGMKIHQLITTTKATRKPISVRPRRGRSRKASAVATTKPIARMLPRREPPGRA